MDEREMVSRAEAVSQIRSMAVQFADLYFCFVQEIRAALGDEAAREMVRRVLFQRARERAQAMVERADARGSPARRRICRRFPISPIWAGCPRRAASIAPLAWPGTRASRSIRGFANTRACIAT